MVSKPDAKGDPTTGEQNRPFPNIYGDQFVNKIVSGGINSLVMTAGYHAFGGDGFEDDMYSKFNWQSMTYSPYDLGSFVGTGLQTWVQERGARADAYDKAQQNRQSNGASRGNFENARQDDIGFFDRAMQMLSTGYKWLDSADKAIKGVFQDIGEIAGTWLQGLGCMALEGIEALGEGIAGLWNGAKEVVSSMWNGVFGGSAQTPGDIWAKYFGDGSYLKLSQADQEKLWQKYSEEMRINGVDVTEEKGKGIESRYWMRAIKEMVGYKELSKEGINIIGIRKDSKDEKGGYSKTTYNDIFLVIIDGELKGIFYGSTEPGAKGSTSQAYTVLDEGQYVYKLTDKTDFQKKLQHENEILTPEGKPTAKLYDENGKIIKEFGDKHILFHYGGNKLLVESSSWGCQVISGGGFIDEKGRYVSGKSYTGNEPHNVITGSGANQGAYNAFISLIRDYTKSTGNINVNYTLINDKKINNDIFYDSYRKSLGLK